MIRLAQLSGSKYLTSYSAPNNSAIHKPPRPGSAVRSPLRVVMPGTSTDGRLSVRPGNLAADRCPAEETDADGHRAANSWPPNSPRSPAPRTTNSAPATLPATWNGEVGEAGGHGCRRGRRQHREQRTQQEQGTENPPGNLHAAEL